MTNTAQVLTPLSPRTRIYIAGHRGLVGSALWRHFTDLGYRNLIGRTSAELDLRDNAATSRFFEQTQPEVVILAAATVGGIMANSTRPADFFSDNLRIQLNVIDSAVEVGARRLLFLGSSCIYPKFAAQPIQEETLLTGPLEATNQAYAMAKIAGIAHLCAIRQQFRLPYITAMPTNLYGPHDNFDPHDSHVLPAMIRRFDEAARTGADQVVCWGSGRPRREFLHVDDLAEACHVLLDHYDDDAPANVGAGSDLSIAELAELVASVVGFDGEITWDSSKPDGTPRKILDGRKLAELGWKPSIALADGIRSTHEWFVTNRCGR